MIEFANWKNSSALANSDQLSHRGIRISGRPLTLAADMEETLVGHLPSTASDP